MSEKEYYTRLYLLASHLNKAYSLGDLLQTTLEKTVELLGVKTGWIWLTEFNDQPVYLAASYNLPPALKDHPERLSGFCYCIKQYFEDDLDEAKNVSEIICSRLMDLKSGTDGLRYHAVIPIRIDNQKVGIMNLLSKENEQLDDRTLQLLNAISELIASAIQRIRKDENSVNNKSHEHLNVVTQKILVQQIEKILVFIEGDRSDKRKLEEIKNLSTSLLSELKYLIQEGPTLEAPLKTDSFYPSTPLSSRELEVLALVKDGLTNSAIGERMYIAERTVKFHMSSILLKLQVKNRVEAVNVGIKRGLIGS